MKKCKLVITTIVDGQEHSIAREGEMDLSLLSPTLIYREENGTTRICLKGETAEIERIGDYTMRLNLVREQFTEGEIGIGGSSGAIQSYAHRIQYSVSERSLLLLLHYDLIISGETQKMQIRLAASYL